MANSEIKIKVLPLIWLFPKRTLNSLCKVKIILFHIKLYRDGISQYIHGININPNKVLSQFREDPIKVLGSNVENRSVIIFRLIV